MSLSLRPACPDDIPALNTLIERSARLLSIGYYTPAEIESAVRYVFGVDTTLVADGTYFVVHVNGVLAGCGGWSKRRTLYGGDQRPVDADASPADRAADQLQPGVDAAKVRAFFVSPNFARRGIGRFLLDACLAAARDSGFDKVELMATLPGVPFYAALGFAPMRDVTDHLPDGTSLRFVQMERVIRTPSPHRP